MTKSTPIVINASATDASSSDLGSGANVSENHLSRALSEDTLMNFVEGRIALLLEGGYNLDSIAKSTHACVEVLLEDEPIVGSSEAYLFEFT
ncbi:Histone deacetylase [Arachis hypogaea]|nr:Histone deacetylase [Arachis hypogaea]